MRLGILQTGQGSYRIVWSHHHILMDGWCLPILLGEWMELYRAKRTGTPAQLGEALPYRALIDWLEGQEKDEALSYWRAYVAGYEAQAGLPQKSIIGAAGSQYDLRETVLTVEEAMTARLEEVAKRYRVTLNTVMQTLWGVVLGRYNGTQDVVFGSVVSGRPADIVGVESMIGLFINTIPVRVSWKAEQRLATCWRRCSSGPWK